MVVTVGELVLRIIVAAILGGIIGFERDRHRRPVGLRTHLIVSMTAGTFMVVSTHFIYWQHYGKDDLASVDTSRIAASVVSAIGFLAAGAILRTGVSVSGLTTAAGLWLVTAIGMAAGSGMYIIAVVSTMIGIIALTVLRRFEDKDDNVVRRRMVVVTDDEGEVDLVLKALEDIGAKVVDLELERRLEEGKRGRRLMLDLRFPESVTVPRLVTSLETLRGVRRIVVQQRT